MNQILKSLLRGCTANQPGFLGAKRLSNGSAVQDVTISSRSGVTARTATSRWRRRLWRVTLTGLGTWLGLQILDSQKLHRDSQAKTLVIWTKDSIIAPGVRTLTSPASDAPSPAGKLPDLFGESCAASLGTYLLSAVEVGRLPSGRRTSRASGSALVT